MDINIVSLLTLNVCGIASKFLYNILTKYLEKFDIICLSETKLYNIPPGEFPNYDIISLKQKSSLHGISIIIRSGLFPYVKKVSSTTSKCVLWVLVGSSNKDFTFLVGSVYIPGEGSKFSDKHDFEQICEDITALSTKYACPLVLMGDFNSRTGTLCDFYDAFENFSDTELKQNTNSQGIVTDRYNSDKKVDTHGRNLIKMCRDFSLNIVNGRFGNDKKEGKFTCLKPTGHSVVDYAVVSNCLLPFIVNFHIDVFDRCMSDVHVPVGKY